jgi:hypothetical protein
MLPVEAELPEEIVITAVRELPGGTMILPLSSRITGPDASNKEVRFAGFPVGAAAAVRAFIALDSVLPKLKLTGVTADPLTAAFLKSVKVTGDVAVLAVTLEM